MENEELKAEINRLIGENTINHRNGFDADYNTEVRLGETPRGGSLIASKAAAAIAIES